MKNNARTRRQKFGNVIAKYNSKLHLYKIDLLDVESQLENDIAAVWRVRPGNQRFHDEIQVRCSKTKTIENVWL